MNKSDYTVNKVKFFRGHDGDGFNTNLLCNGKVVATVDDDDRGLISSLEIGQSANIPAMGELHSVIRTK